MRIDCLLQERKGYTFECYAAAQFAKVLGSCFQTIYLGDGVLQDYLLHLQKTPPDWTIAFTDLLLQDKPLCDIIQIPHFFWVEGSLSTAVHYLPSKYARVGVSDLAYCKRLAQPNLCFMPHAVDLALANERYEKRPFEVVLFADLVDTDCMIESWETLFSKEIVALMRRCCDRCLRNREFLPIEGIARELEESRIMPNEVSLNDLLYGVESYLKARRISELIGSFEGVRLDVFGEHVGNNWLKRLKNSEWIYLHAKLPFTEHFEVLKLSKMVLLDVLDATDSLEKWFLPALAAGCFPLINETPYLKELLGENQALFYPSRDWKKMMEKVHYFLSHPSSRQALIDRLQEELLPDHSWEKRAKQWLTYIDVKL
ncbi:MAG: glycosyltransferase [Chlamydiales bacterium]